MLATMAKGTLPRATPSGGAESAARPLIGAPTRMEELPSRRDAYALRANVSTTPTLKVVTLISAFSATQRTAKVTYARAHVKDAMPRAKGGQAVMTTLSSC